MAKGQAFLQELREFLAFLASLWGLLAAVSVFFPLSNLLTKAVPLGDSDKPFHNVSPALVALLTTLSCLFLTFALITRAFLLLAMLEYFPQGHEAGRSPDDG